MVKFLQGCILGVLCFTLPILVYIYTTGGF